MVEIPGKTTLNEKAVLTSQAPQMDEDKSVGRPESAPAVLIVEDTVELAEIVRATLERMHLKVFHETHGNKALDVFSAENPDLVLLDIALPDTTGWKVLETIRERRQDSKSPVIIVITAYGDPANRLMGKLQGVHSYLIKPFTPDEIEQAVSKALGLSKK